MARSKTTPGIREIPTLTGERVTLRALRPMDATAIYRALQDRAVSRWLNRVPNPYLVDNAREWVAATRAMAAAGTDYHFGIQLNETGEIVGMIGLNNVSLTDSNAELGYWLARAHWRQGLTREAIHLLLPFSFERLGLRRVYAIVLAPNDPSWRLLEKVGFVREGISREARRQGNRWCHVYSYGLLRAEYTGRGGISGLSIS